jgi:hypothetical protein
MKMHEANLLNGVQDRLQRANDLGEAIESDQ